ncbi:MAG: hypothetical protein LBL36_00580, partial [Clostridiales Family XIII bacterium]|nr:hypothetical protein [Clostridiales Family XIII bacterium]
MQFMKTTARRKKLALFVALIMALTLWTAVPLTASADTQTSSVEIQATDTVSEIQAKIQEALDEDDVETVTVTGTKTDADETLTLAIPENVTLLWAATYTGTMEWGVLISLSGEGAFEVGDGGTVSINGESGYAIWADNSTIAVRDGGTVSAVGDYSRGIYVCYNADNPDHISVIVSGGTVRATGMIGGTDAIYFSGEGSAVVSGGTVIAEGYECKAIYGAYNLDISGNASVSTTMDDSTTISGLNVNIGGNAIVSSGDNSVTISSAGTVIVNGGTVSATSGNAIQLGFSDLPTGVTVNGGVVCATTGYAISLGSIFLTISDNIKVNGGCIVAYGEEINGQNNVIYSQYDPTEFMGPTGTGVVIAWDEAAYDDEPYTFA